MFPAWRELPAWRGFPASPGLPACRGGRPSRVSSPGSRRLRELLGSPLRRLHRRRRAVHPPGGHSQAGWHPRAQGRSPPTSTVRQVPPAVSTRRTGAARRARAAAPSREPARPDDRAGGGAGHGSRPATGPPRVVQPPAVRQGPLEDPEGTAPSDSRCDLVRRSSAPAVRLARDPHRGVDGPGPPARSGPTRPRAALRHFPHTERDRARPAGQGTGGHPKGQNATHSWATGRPNRRCRGRRPTLDPDVEIRTAS